MKVICHRESGPPSSEVAEVATDPKMVRPVMTGALKNLQNILAPDGRRVDDIMFRAGVAPGIERVWKVKKRELIHEGNRSSSSGGSSVYPHRQLAVTELRRALKMRTPSVLEQRRGKRGERQAASAGGTKVDQAGEMKARRTA